MKSFKELMASQVLLPIVQADTPEQGIAITDAMVKAGLHLIEVVLRTEASLEALKAIKQAFPSLIVGAGTVTSKEILQGAKEAGADFIITPAISANLLAELATCGLPVLPGVSNTADILLASEFGFNELKLFPASLSGGAPFIGAMSSIFPDTSFCPTGGVNQENKADYLKLGNCFAIGGSWVAPKNWVENGQWDKITDACKLANQS
ncbi:bifunctional 4-hydroxy-2-oxoglutarate aldolase/2-dehydro-3-deoxy-phosphogluconate aldolase [Colwellia sp. 1_MG-2023]|uniref:bifunctional 4-hydroxy-2-oxoglutarate aldolase/2-dehydro-3-deoxy-phosphogluconate aldolase n=1 Tax=Colwellia sp. 1_MG-2023 TaxID=3062649 RepID=UPI0026E33456|nr:bifunctional 4-hydroxy-2-oxoglutarate aldolase/2-dehydro-3-deoxy-phosphogluconate aldolase [Colwellia sp. 1_MG-2023]MDO6444468.1 bifunctional 4-hydroxy-2-oxoglutarate aldolase/2-dehydro-3-deoxy-phosphogluconate aldolase [Colwellia sp. 1_MG-2023]